MIEEQIGKEKVIRIFDVADYQKDAVVSKTIHDKETGSVTVFAFDRGQGLSEHTAPYAALVYVVDGTFEIRISNELFEVNKGEALIMPANKPHALKALTKCKMLLIMIRS